jgi:hypothetical protein
MILIQTSAGMQKETEYSAKCFQGINSAAAAAGMCSKTLAQTLLLFFPLNPTDSSFSLLFF